MSFIDRFEKGDVIAHIGDPTKWLVWGTTDDLYKCWSGMPWNRVFHNFNKPFAEREFVKVGNGRDAKEEWTRIRSEEVLCG